MSAGLSERAPVRIGPEVTLRRVTRRYGDTAALRGLDLDLEPGSLTAIMGPNGCGKTTLARLLLGLDTPDAGTVGGLDDCTRGAVFQEDRLCDGLSALDNVRLALDRRAWGEAARVLADVGLDHESWAKPAGELSGGQRRRVAIARALAADAELVVLDEPFTGVDPESKPALLAFVRERLVGRTAVVVTHDFAEAEALGARVVRL